MATHSDLTFITNENGQNLLERFKVLIKDTECFDVLVGYFYTSGFHALYQALEKTRKIRILIGISTNKTTLEFIEQSRQSELQFSHAETKEHFSDLLVGEMTQAEDSKHVEEGVVKFLEWLQNGKLEIKAYPTENIHAKLYIMTFDKEDRDAGRVITGSSNFTQSGLVNNLEFNVELKNRADYEFARTKFEGLWENAVDVKDTYIQTICNKTWLNNTITPYELYLKFLYEYFKDDLYQTEEATSGYLPEEFKRLEYQEQAVINAKKILDEYGGVFISDVVGLGKTYVSAMLASRLDGRTLVLAPPVLLDKANPGSWPNVFSDFRVPAHFESMGKLDHLTRSGTQKYNNVFIDEAHRYRTESNVTYEKIAQICRGKRVVLVTATPFNNSPKDILGQIKLFQNAKKSTIPNVPNLEKFFGTLEKRIKQFDRQRDHEEYMRTTRENAHRIRTSVLKYLMVRRTRKEIEDYFTDDLTNQGLSFPAVEDPEPLFYQLNGEENEIFNRTVELLTQRIKYARYKPMLYYTGEDTPDQAEIQAQKNMGRFMKILLVKRLESSFHAFRNSIARFISNHERFLRELAKGNVYVSKKYMNKIFELLDNDDEEEAIQQLLESDKARQYPAEDFNDELRKDLENDLQTLKEIQAMWLKVTRDPKLLAFVETLSTRSVLKDNKLIVFTESAETADYLAKNLKSQFHNEVLAFTGASGENVRRTAIENFDARARSPKDEYRILITTEVLSEGVNLHRSNVVINYDIPWNPTRLMQRVGRINRVDTAFDKIYSFNFFPTEQSNEQIKLKEAAEAKIHAFITLLGADARLLTEGEDVESHELFNRLISRKTITGEDEGEESELKYLQVIRGIRDNAPDLFEKIKRLPKKARTAKKYGGKGNQLLTYFRKGKLQKFFMVDKSKSEEVDLIRAAGWLEAETKTPREKLPPDFYDKLGKNKQAFTFATTEEDVEFKAQRGGSDSTIQVLKFLMAVRDFRQYTEAQEAYLKRVMNRLEEGAFPKQTSKTVLKALAKESKTGQPNPLKVLALLQNNIPEEFLESHVAENAAHVAGPREVILSEYLIGEAEQ
ncbi:MAG: helicase [Nitrospira sp. SB0675_bin_23]|nr:helicase [Nitrospira sp. SB0675_bin_23]